MISAKDLEYFIEVAKCQNLSRASERLGLAQPSVSNCIKRLEADLDIELFIRSKTGVKLTQAGKQLLAHSREMQQYWHDVKTKACQSHTEISGSYILGCHPSVALNHIQGALAKIISENKNLELSIIHDISRKIVEKVINMEIDVGVVVNPIKHPSLVIIKIRDDEIGIWHNFTSEELQNSSHAIICDPELSQTIYVTKKIKAMATQVAISKVIHSKNLELNAKLALSKAGLAIIPKSLAFITSEKLKLLDKSPLFYDEICIVFRPECKKVRAIQQIISTLKQCRN